VIGAKAAVEKLAKDRPGLVTPRAAAVRPREMVKEAEGLINGGGAPQSLEERTTAELSATGRYRQF
jgi:hypothetical protein